MQHRQPRLGDILDDYCPRERRITNHAVVAMVGPDIKQTRCTTCDAEHEYKHARVPTTRRKKEAPAALYKQVLTSAQPEALRAAESEQPPASEAAPPAPVPVSEVSEPEPAPVVAAAEAPAETPPEDEPAVAAEEAGDDDGPVHRRLIRATLPRPEGPLQRPVPQFTVRQPGKFGGSARGGGRPQGGGIGSMSRMRPSPSRGAFGRNGTRGDTFTARPSGGSHHALQRSRPAHRPAGRPARHGKKSPK
jgi:hypothetical protein